MELVSGAASCSAAARLSGHAGAASSVRSVNPPSPASFANPGSSVSSANPASPASSASSVNPANPASSANSASSASSANPASSASSANPANPASSARNSRTPLTPNGPRRPPRLLANAPRNEAPPAANNNRVIVIGYPSYTQAQDIMRVFSKIGSVKVESINPHYAILNFTNPEEVTAALQANRKFNIYGQFVAVKPYNERHAFDLRRVQHTPKKDFRKNKPIVPIIDPIQIDLTGDFHHQLDNIMAAVRLTQENVTVLSKLYTDVELVLQSLWPGCTAIPFGSITTGLGIKSSDADCFINVPPQFRHPNANFVIKAKKLLQQHPKNFTEIVSIPRANTPIVKFFHIPTETNCDLTFKTPLGAQNSKLIAFLLHADPRLIPMAVLIKYWAKVHDISGTGKLTNYALTMMIIFYLQQPHVGILPAVEFLQRDASNDFIVDFWNTGFVCQRDHLRPTTNRSSISELLGGFYEYYALFNFEELAVCPYMGVPLKKIIFRDMSALPQEFHRYKNNVLQANSLPLRFNTPMCVQDPFEQCHNVASAITMRLSQDIKAYFKLAAGAYEKEKLNNCENFLRIILIQKPKLMRGKGQPEFRVNLFPRIITTIVSSDWKSVVRDIIFSIFEKMMKIKLGKVEEKVNPDTRKEKEKYTGVVTKPIWKRKQLNRLYAVMNLDFELKQEKITDEIIRIDRQELNVQFQLSLTFTHEPRSAVVSVRLCGGDIDGFRDFGKFFITVMQSWFTQQLKCYETTEGKDMTTKIAETIEFLNVTADANKIQDTDDESPTSGYIRKDLHEPEEETSPTKISPTDEHNASHECH